MDTSSSIFVFSSDGSPLPAIETEESLGLGRRVRAAAVDDETGALFIGTTVSFLALDLRTHARRWATDERINCFGIAVLPVANNVHGPNSMVFACSHSNKTIFVFSAVDGELAQKVQTDSVPVFIHAIRRHAQCMSLSTHHTTLRVMCGMKAQVSCTQASSRAQALQMDSAHLQSCLLPGKNHIIPHYRHDRNSPFACAVSAWA